jgi:hypothetical protein
MGDLTLTGDLPLTGGTTAKVTLTISITEPPVPEPQPGPPAPAQATAPHLAVSFHPWDPYWAAGDNATPLLTKHLDAMQTIHEAGPHTFSRIRVDVGWSTSQPTAALPTTSQWYNKRLERLFVALRLRGLKPYAVVHQSPPWSRTKTTLTAASSDPKQFPTDPASIEPWAQWFAASYAEHIDEIEFWNEPNLSAFSGAGQATPERYVPLLKAFAAGARRGNPNVKIIAPNVSQCDWRWIQRCYELGMAPYADIIGVHPYQGRQSIAPASVSTSGIDKSQVGWEKYRIALGLPKIYEVMTWAGDANKPIWNTEAGWGADTTDAGVGSAGVPKTWATLDHKAAHYHRQWLDMCVTGRDAGGPQEAYKHVTLSTVYELYDPLSADAHQKGFEIIHADGTFKPQARELIAWRSANQTLRPLY